MHRLDAHRPTAAYIDLDALADNFSRCREFIGSEFKYMAVVKANAYGHGSVPCSLKLESAGADWFGVAMPEEGVELRRGGVAKPILCFGLFWPRQEELILDYQLTPVVFNIETAVRLSDFAAQRGVVIGVHVKIDTGMGRVGIRMPDVGNFALKFASMRKTLRVDGLMTHFAAAENPEENEYTAMQIAAFDEALETFRAAGHDPEFIDLANSPGAVRHPASRGNLIRLGGALYGLLDDILPSGTIGPGLRPVLSLRSRIADIKSIAAGETLGYGRTFVTTSLSNIALVPIGYADGFPRALSNCGHAVVNGVLVPIVGRVSMDWTLIDVTSVGGVAIEDEVTLIGNGINAADIAGLTGTIGYEITCALSSRVPRIYE